MRQVCVHSPDISDDVHTHTHTHTHTGVYSLLSVLMYSCAALLFPPQLCARTLSIAGKDFGMLFSMETESNAFK